MKLSPLGWGIAAGLAAMALLAPIAGNALGDLSVARSERTKLAAAVAAPETNRTAMVVQGQALSDPAALALRIRELARNGGVLVEEASPPSGTSLIAIRFRISGPEKAVIALADALERETPLVRLRGWKLVAIEGGVRLTGEAVAVKK
jgi:hypothetical protein